MTECPQGCTHPVHGDDTMRVEEERRQLNSPRVVEVPGGPAVVKEETKRYLECRVCGGVVDI
jgi:hypothetical protein